MFKQLYSIKHYNICVGFFGVMIPERELLLG